MKNSPPKHKGFTLLEVIISLAVISILIVGTYGLTVGATKNTASGEIKQKASSYGQRIFEDFRSTDVTKTLTGSNFNYVLKLSNGINLKGNSSYKVLDYDLKKVDEAYNGYKADIEVTRNSSTIGSGQTPVGNASTTDYSYTVNLKKDDLRSVAISDETNKNHWNAKGLTDEEITKATEIDVDIDSDENGKKITVNIDGGDSVSKSFPFGSINLEDDKKKEIILSINCSQYNLTGENKEKDKGFEVHVFNHDKVPVNICLQKTNTIDGSASAEVGKYRLYNNRSSSENVSNMGNLYDITVKVKKDNESKEPIFTGEISQNLRIDDQTTK